MSRPKQVDPGLYMYATERQKEVLDAITKHGSQSAAARALGVNQHNVSMMYARLELHAIKRGYVPANAQPEVLPERPSAPATADLVPDDVVCMANAWAAEHGGINRYVVTWAQNATPVHGGFWASLKRYAAETGAHILVIPGRYKNPTSQWTDQQEDAEYWAPEVMPYRMDRRVNLSESLVIMGDLKMQPTAVRPLSGLQTITGPASAIFGHPKIELETIATPHHKLPKILTTTGACTVENYTDSKAGKKGEFHHVIGACVVEVDGDLFHIWQINAQDDGSFIDLNREYTPTESRPAGPALALVMGDIHTQFMDPDVEAATFGAGGMLDVLKPGAVVLHDWYDGYSGSHHHINKPFTRFAKHHSGLHNVEREIDLTFQRTRQWLRDGLKFYVVGSNHNEHLIKWLELGEPKNDPENALFYHRLMTKVYERIQMGRGGAMVPNPLEIIAKEKAETDPAFLNLHFVGRDDSLMFSDTACDQHGDKGANGAKGNRDTWSRAGMKTITGHAHGPFIRDGAMGVGTSSLLRLEYNVGLSNWLQTHAVIYANGKRCLLNIIGGRWRHVHDQVALTKTEQSCTGEQVNNGGW